MSPYLADESAIMDFAAVIRGAADPDEAAEKARAAGYSTQQIEDLMDDAMCRNFWRDSYNLEGRSDV